MRPRTAMMATVLTCGISALAACGGGAPSGAGAVAEIVIGDITSQSGQYSICGPSDVTLKIAVDEINAAGGVDVGGNRYTFRIESIDDQSDTAQASAAARQLLQSGAKVVFGPCGAGAASVLQFTRENQVVLVSAASSAAAEIRPGAAPQYLLTALPSVADRVASAVAAVEQFAPTARTMVMVGSDDPTFGAVVAETTTAWQAAGGTVSSVLYPPGTSDLSGFLARVTEQDPDVLYIGQNPQSVTLALQQLDAAGIGKDVVVVGHGTEAPLAAEAGGRAFVAAPFSPGPLTGDDANPATAQLVEKFLRESGEQQLPAFSPPIRYHYDIMYILADAMREAGTVDDMDAVLQVVLGQDLDYEGALGEVSFTDDGFIRFPLVSTYVAPDGAQQLATWTPGTYVARDGVVGLRSVTPAGTAEQEGPILELRGLHAYYSRAAHVVRSVDLVVGRGQVVGLLGANGAGKSSTLRAISGVIGCTGEVLFDGRPLTGGPEPRARLGLAHVPEGRQIIGSMTVTDNLLLGQHAVRRRSREAGRMDSVLELFPELVPLLRRSAGWLSGGEQQMVAIGRALMAQPKMMLLDEPSMGLAPIVVSRLGLALETLRSQGTAVLLAEENLGFAADVAPTCCVLRAGRVAWTGPTAQVLTDPDLKSLFLG